MFFATYLSTLIFVSCASLVLAQAETVSPPSTVQLIHPEGTLQINSRVKIGFGYNGPPYQGFLQSINSSLQWPNGTESASLRSIPMKDHSCRAESRYNATATMTLDQVGNYTIFWNVTYGLSSDPTQANSTYCGPEPFSYQSWLLNSTFRVDSNPARTDRAVLSTFVETTLPGSPTGSLKVPVTSSSSSGGGEGAPAGPTSTSEGAPTSPTSTGAEGSNEENAALRIRLEGVIMGIVLLTLTNLL
ncbi:hypothetical protein VNI00_006027 [Paramarasmius palmivorus]|uniref:Uncharacterized protein n=1 Tax=Paramarasmius palmivorus TaxID=297713 RepID=A0AAW0DGZ8_9AGAR